MGLKVGGSRLFEEILATLGSGFPKSFAGEID